MSCTAWRIAVEAPTYKASDMSGAGAKRSGGRWNSVGVPLVYASNNIALAALETLTAARAATIPSNRYLVRLDIPDAVWEARLELSPPPGGWDALPCGMTSKAAGDAWVKDAPSALLLVPSVIIPDEFNILINPRHPQARDIVAMTVKRFTFDPRFFSA